MNRMLLPLSAAVMLSAGSPARAEEKTDNPKAAQQTLYVDYLKEEGYKPEVDKDGDVKFKKEGRVFYFIIYPDDPGYFNLVMPNIWSLESEDERKRALEAVDFSNSKSKVAKLYTTKDNIWASIEMFLDKPEDFKPLFNRSMSALENGVNGFAKRMREEK